MPMPLKPALTLGETLRFWAAVFQQGRVTTDADWSEAAEAVGLGHALELPVGVLSAGQRRRAALARLILSPRPLWLLDEPTAALDSDGEALLQRLMQEHIGARRDDRRRNASGAARAARRDVAARCRVSALAAIVGQTAAAGASRRRRRGRRRSIFFLAVVTVVPFGVGPDLQLLARIGPAILWIAALLASLLGLDRLFGADREDGSLDLVVVSGEPLAVYALGRAVGHWLATGLPIVDRRARSRRCSSTSRRSPWAR